MKDGGPAFPQAAYEGIGNLRTQLIGGMSLRDYFAAHVMTVVLSMESFGQGESSLRIDAARCYQFADAMLAEREK